VAVIGAIVLLFAGLAGLLASWNAARPLGDPTRRYSPAWLPSMVVTELAPFWLLVHAAVLAVGLLLGGWADRVGRFGALLVVASMSLLALVLVRTSLAVRRLRRLVLGPVPDASGWSILIGRPVPTPTGVREHHGIEWRAGLTLDLIRPDDDRRALPVLVYVHGGGWTGGDPQRQARVMYHVLALDGWATMAIRYPFTPHVSLEQQVDVVRAAITWSRTGATRHGIDASRVAIAGGSAGGHLATMAALTARGPNESVDACVALYGVFDMANRNRTRARWTTIENSVMMASVAQAPDRYTAMSPLDRIHDASPPVLVVHGERDTLVPIGEAEQFVAALAAAGRPFDYVPVPGAQHAFDALSSPITRTTSALIRDWLRTTVLDG
jgi:acetyl esterase/lipase